MKSIKLMSLIVCAFALSLGTANLQAGCCDDAKKAGKEATNAAWKLLRTRRPAKSAIRRLRRKTKPRSKPSL
jgi:hypothetical protein